MNTLYATKHDESEFYAQVEVHDDLLKFLDKLALFLFDENWMIDDHYRGKIADHDYFSCEQDGIYLGIVIGGGRANLIIRGYSDNSDVKKLVFEHYSFERS